MLGCNVSWFFKNARNVVVTANLTLLFMPVFLVYFIIKVRPKRTRRLSRANTRSSLSNPSPHPSNPLATPPCALGACLQSSFDVASQRYKIDDANLADVSAAPSPPPSPLRAAAHSPPSSPTLPLALLKQIFE